jgi:hypothetical protein
MKIVGKYYSIDEAERARLELLSIGVEAEIENEFSATIAPHLMLGSSAGVKLLVDESDFVESVKILKEVKETKVVSTDSPPYARYRFAILLGAFGSFFTESWIPGVIAGVFALAALVTLYNYGIDRGYRAGRSSENAARDRPRSC